MDCVVQADLVGAARQQSLLANEFFKFDAEAGKGWRLNVIRNSFSTSVGASHQTSGSHQSFRPLDDQTPVANGKKLLGHLLCEVWQVEGLCWGALEYRLQGGSSGRRQLSRSSACVPSTRSDATGSRAAGLPRTATWYERMTAPATAVQQRYNGTARDWRFVSGFGPKP